MDVLNRLALLWLTYGAPTEWFVTIYMPVACQAIFG